MDSKWSMFSVLKIPGRADLWILFKNQEVCENLHCLMKIARHSLNLPKPLSPSPPRRSLDLTPNGQGQRTQAPAASKSIRLPLIPRHKFPWKPDTEQKARTGYSKLASDLQPDFIRFAGLFLLAPACVHCRQTFADTDVPKLCSPYT